MLILSRRSGEAIIVDEKVTLTVLSIKGRQVRIGIDAPDDVSVHREEIYQRIKSGEDTGYGAAKSKGGETAETSSNVDAGATDLGCDVTRLDTTRSTLSVSGDISVSGDTPVKAAQVVVLTENTE